MKIKRMSWWNYRGLADGAINADGSDVLIHGQNGVGKSTIASVVPFVLFGKVTGTVKKYESGKVPTDDGLIHGAKIEFEDGTSLQREYYWTAQGNRQNLYVNGEPVKLTAYKVAVARLTQGGGELVMNPFAFSELSAADQREWLIKICGTVEDKEIFALPEFAAAEKIFEGLSAEVFMARTKVELKHPRAEVNGIPYRIAELEREAKPTANEAELARQIEELRGERTQVLAAEIDVAELTAAREELARLTMPNPNANRATELRRQIDYHERKKTEAAARREELLEKYFVLANMERGKCPTCGQLIPVEKFEARREKELARIVADGQSCKAEIAEHEELLAELNDALTKVPVQVPAENQIAALKERIRTLEEKRSALESERRKKLDELEARIGDLVQSLNRVRVVANTQKRIAELRTREQDLNRQIAEMERELALADKFLQRKIELSEARISEHFEHIRFKLFTYVITTGEVKPTCEVMLNGVPYSALSKGEKLKASLDIWRTLQKKLGVELPLMIDDAESYTRNSFVDVPNQIWLFKVSDAPRLTIEVKKETRAAA